MESPARTSTLEYRLVAVIGDIPVNIAAINIALIQEING
jgi:hypothetical protein